MSYTVKQLLRITGLISARTCGGIHLTDQHQVIDAPGKVHENLFCVGPVANYNHLVPTHPSLHLWFIVMLSW